MKQVGILVLAALLLQNVSSTLFRRYVFGVQGSAVSKTEMLLASEIIKGAFSAWYTAADSDDTSGRWGVSKVLWLIDPRNSYQMSLLAALYGAMNVASFYALANISASTFTVLVQLKILSTALFAVVLLGRKLSLTKWRALVLLICGCLLVSSPQLHGGSGGAGGSKAVMAAQMGGILAVLGEAIGSGFASIYFEKVIKSGESNLSIWDRNVQLSFWSTWIFVIMLAFEQAVPEAHPLMHGWNGMIWVIILIISAGGILVALSVKHADSIAKTITITGAVAVNATFDSVFLGGAMSIEMMIGVVVTMIATLNYSFDVTVEDPKPPRPSIHSKTQSLSVDADDRTLKCGTIGEPTT